MKWRIGKYLVVSMKLDHEHTNNYVLTVNLLVTKW